MPSTGNSQLIKQNHYSESSNQEVFVFRGFMTLSLLVPWLCASWLSLTQTQSFQVGCWVHRSPLSAECTGVHSVTWVPSPFWGSLNHWHCQCPCIFKAEHGGKRSLVGCSPWGREESDTPEQLPFHFSLSCTGEGNGNPLQCSCLENPRDRGPGGLPSMGSHRAGHDWSDSRGMEARVRLSGQSSYFFSFAPITS